MSQGPQSHDAMPLSPSSTAEAEHVQGLQIFSLGQVGIKATKRLEFVDHLHDSIVFSDLIVLKAAEPRLRDADFDFCVPGSFDGQSTLNDVPAMSDITTPLQEFYQSLFAEQPVDPYKTFLFDRFAILFKHSGVQTRPIPHLSDGRRGPQFIVPLINAVPIMHDGEPHVVRPDQVAYIKAQTEADAPTFGASQTEPYLGLRIGAIAA